MKQGVNETNNLDIGVEEITHKYSINRDYINPFIKNVEISEEAADGQWLTIKHSKSNIKTASISEVITKCGKNKDLNDINSTPSLKLQVIEADKPDIGVVHTYNKSSINTGYISEVGNNLATTRDLDDISLTPSLKLRVLEQKG